MPEIQTVVPPVSQKKSEAPSAPKTPPHSNKPKPRAQSASDPELTELLRQALSTRGKEIETVRLAVILDGSRSMGVSEFSLAASIGFETRKALDQIADGKKVEYRVFLKKGNQTRGVAGDEYVPEMDAAARWLQGGRPQDKKMAILVADGQTNYGGKHRGGIGLISEHIQDLYEDADRVDSEKLLKEIGEQGVMSGLFGASEKEKKTWIRKQISLRLGEFERSWNTLVQSSDRVFYFATKDSPIRHRQHYLREVDRLIESGRPEREWPGDAEKPRVVADVVAVAMSGQRDPENGAVRVNLDVAGAHKQGLATYSRAILKKTLKQVLGKK